MRHGKIVGERTPRGPRIYFLEGAGAGYLGRGRVQAFVCCRCLAAGEQVMHILGKSHVDVAKLTPGAVVRRWRRRRVSSGGTERRYAIGWRQKIALRESVE